MATFHFKWFLMFQFCSVKIRSKRMSLCFFLFAGDDVSICVCLAILISLFTEEGIWLPLSGWSSCSILSDKRHGTLLWTSTARSSASPSTHLKCYCHYDILFSLFILLGTYDEGRSFNERSITKWEMRQRLVFICKYATVARPSRGNLKQVFAFLSGGRSSSNWSKAIFLFLLFIFS